LNKGNLLTEDMVCTLAEQAATEGDMDQSEREFIHNIFKFGNQTVSDIMTPSTNINFIRLGTPVESVMSFLKKNHHTRVPVYDEHKTEILGTLHFRDLLKMDISELKEPGDVRKVLRKPVLVPESKLVTDTFNMFTERKLSIALVVNEYGNVTGLVTLENLLKSIFGEFGDMLHHTDGVPDNGIVPMDSNRFRIDATITVESFNNAFGEDIPSPANVKTLAGLIMHHHGELPREADHVIIGDWRFDVESVSGTRVKTVSAMHMHHQEELDRMKSELTANGRDHTDLHQTESAA
jgi:CBS domain containing-hemolysin-like protein